MRTALLITVATPLFALIAHGQQFSTGYPSSQSDTDLQMQQGITDCSDPTMANSPLCGLDRTGGYGQVAIPFGNGVSPLSLQSGRVTNYRDDYSRTGQTRTGTERKPIRPELLTEFQKFVATTTGNVLPIYGAELFQNVPSTFAPLENTPVPPDYILGPDDELRIRVWGQVNFNANLHVDRGGDVYIPQVGQVHIAGLRFDEAQQHIHDAVARVYRNFQMQLDVGQIRSIQVYVTGEARQPGVYTVSSLSTLVDALFSSGGPSVQGSMRRIELRRNGQMITTLDLYALLVSGDKSRDSKLLSGDVIYIPPVGKEVAVIGSVRRQAVYELLDGDTVDNVLRDAGGVTALASNARLSVERTMEHSERTAMEMRLDAAGRATPLQEGDIVRVFSLVTKFQNTVTVRGNVANPGRFAWREGMRLSDLIPDRESLLTRNYWWKRVQLGLPAPEFEPIPSLTSMRQPTSPVDLRSPTMQQRRSTRTGTGTGNGNNPGTQQTSNNAQGTMDQQQTPSTGALATESAYPESLAGQVEETTIPQNTSDPNEQQRSTVAGNQTALAEPDTETNELLTPRPKYRNVVRAEVPDIDWSYAVIERMDPNTLKTSLVPFDLGKLVVDHDASQDLALQPGDVVTVFSQSDIHVPLDEQTTFVRLEGEFVHAGTYSVRPGDTLRSLVERAGGLTPNAYLYGSTFTRESTRILQQRRIDESVHELIMQMQRGNMALAASPTSNAQDLASINAAQSSEQALVTQLQQVRANGRIVFQFTPDSKTVSTVPEIKLENGDTFLVPSVPSTVSVVGAVFNQNAFVYRPRGQVESFLNLAGGPNSNADKRRIFVVRANGAVVSKTMVKSAWSNGFAHLELYPGDTVIVPEKVIKPSALRGVLDWTQIFSQLAFGAAAINVLR